MAPSSSGYVVMMGELGRPTSETSVTQPTLHGVTIS